MRAAAEAAPKAKYFVQLEDDVIASRGYVSQILEWTKGIKAKDWTMLSFYSPHMTSDAERLRPDQFWGFIGQVRARLLSPLPFTISLSHACMRTLSSSVWKKFLESPNISMITSM